MSGGYEVMLDAADRRLLERVQAGVPLEARPFAALGEAVELDEADVVARLRRLKAAGIVRQVGAIFDTRALGYASTLVAWHVPGGVLDEAAAVVSAHPGVSHNYGRAHHYNLWFTIAVSPGQSLGDEIATLASQAGIDDWLDLPAVRVFKIRAEFALDAAPALAGTAGGDGATADPRPEREGMDPAPARLDARDVEVVRALQEDLALEARPFAAAARQAGMAEEELLRRARALAAAGVLRRFGAVLRHRRVGYTANGMACWALQQERVEAVGRRAAGWAQVSHCYQRPARPPRWPYTLFAMIHGRTVEEVNGVAAGIGQVAGETGPAAAEVLFSTREFKKERIKYFL